MTPGLCRKGLWGMEGSCGPGGLRWRAVSAEGWVLLREPVSAEGSVLLREPAKARSCFAVVLDRLELELLPVSSSSSELGSRAAGQLGADPGGCQACGSPGSGLRVC